MGLDAWYEVVAPREYRNRKSASSDQSSRRRKRYELWREWRDLDDAFQILGKPLNLAIRGDRPTMEQFDADDWGGAYEGYFTLRLLQRISDALAKLSHDNLIEALKSVMKSQKRPFRKYEHKYYTSAVTTMKAAFRAAKRQNSYLRIFIC